MKVGNTRSQWPNPCGGSCRRWDRRLGRSRNKVAVPEGGAGSPPFLGAPRKTPSLLKVWAVRSLSPVVGAGWVRNNNFFCLEARLPAHYWVLRQHPGPSLDGLLCGLLSPRLCGGVWCLVIG